MASTTESILLQVDVTANLQQITLLKKILLDNKEALDVLNKGFKDGSVSADLLAQGQARLGQSSRQAQQEIAVLNKANDAQLAANKAAAGSIEQLRAEYGLSAAALIKLSANERDNTESGQKLQAQTRALNDELKKQEAAYGSTARSVGDYNKGVKDVNVVNGQLTGGFRTAIDKGLAPFRGEIDKASGLLGKFKSGNDLVNQGLSLLKGSGETGALGFKAVAGGIALTGIGLFVIAISAVVSYFTQTAEGGRILAGVLGGLGGVIQVATDAVTSFGKGIVEAVSNPRKALDDFVTFFEEQVTNRFKAFGVILNAIKNGNVYQLTNGVAQLATGVEDVNGKLGRLGTKLKDAYDAAATFAGREKDLAKARRELEKEDAVAESRVAVLLRLSKERGRTATDQLDSLKQAGRIENQLSEDRIKQSQKELTLVNDRIKSAGAAKKGELIADKQARELDIIRAESQQKETNARIQVRESVFREQQRKAAADAAQKAREDAVKFKQTEVEQALLAVEKGGAAELVLRQRLVQLAADAEIAAAKKTTEEKRLIQAKANVEIQNLAVEFEQKQLEIAKKRTEAQNKELLREYKEAETLLNDYLTNKRAAVEADFATGKISENEYQKQLNAIEKAGLDAAMVNNKDYRQDNAKDVKAAADLEIKEATRVKNEKKKIRQAEQDILAASVAAGITASDAIAEAVGKETEAGQAALAIKKTLALAEIGISLQKQLAANAEAGVKIAAEAPPLTIPLGTAYTIATDALAIAGSAAAAAKILGFNKGGVVPGVGNTDSVPAMLTPSETVINATSSQMFPEVLSYLNALGGGVNFAPGFTPGRTSQVDGGLTARTIGASEGIDYNRLAAACAQTPVDINYVAIGSKQAARVAKLAKFSI